MAKLESVTGTAGKFPYKMIIQIWGVYLPPNLILTFILLNACIIKGKYNEKYETNNKKYKILRNTTTKLWKKVSKDLVFLITTIMK